MPGEKLKAFLEARGVRYEVIAHSPVCTTQEAAQSAHIPGATLAKTVMVRMGPKMVMLVLPASRKVDFAALKEAIGFENIRLAAEEEFKGLFPDCEPGAMPPFGNLYDLDVYVTESLAAGEEIAFTAGSHGELIKMSYEDYDRLVDPKMLSFSKESE